LVVLHRHKSSSAEQQSTEFEYILDTDGDVSKAVKERKPAQELVSFPSEQEEGYPVLLNAKEHVVGYLSRILNARVYESAIETELQYAPNLSSVSILI
jgi:hypothetical protein